MNKRAAVGILLLLPSVLIPAVAWGSDAGAWFEQAMRQDDEGHASEAFQAYRRAAEAGLAAAEFNVGAMLDSGRGVDRDVSQAATWYARAAARGNARAAYNLGQLYESGEGVPRNIDQARAWFAASRLAAAQARLKALPASVPTTGTLSAPIPVTPGQDGSAVSIAGGLALVWTASPQPEPVSFFVEMCAVDASASKEVFSALASTTSVLATVPIAGGNYAWRVFAVGRQSRSYAPSRWVTFTVAAN